MYTFCSHTLKPVIIMTIIIIIIIMLVINNKHVQKQTQFHTHIHKSTGEHLGSESNKNTNQQIVPNRKNRFLADRTATQYDRLLAAACCPSVLSVTLCIVALRVGVRG